MNTEIQRNLALEQLQQRKQRKPNWLERWLGLDQAHSDPQQIMEPTPELQPERSPAPGFFAGMADIMASAKEKAAALSDSIRDYFQSTPPPLEIVHIGADKTATRLNPEAQELQVRDSLAVLGTFSPSQTPAFHKPTAEAYQGPQLGMSLRASHV